MSEERLQKILARAGVASRRKVEELITEGRVTVNGAIATLGDKADPNKDAIKVDGKRVQPAHGPHTYLLLNKPRGVMSTLSDPEGRPTVLDLIPPAQRKALVPVGRLDFLTEGLLLLTDDGEMAHKVAHPRYGCNKVYEVKVKGQPDEKSIERIRRGMVLEGHRTAPVRIQPRQTPAGPRLAESTSWWRVELSEGRTRQIREMFFRIGHPVQRLRRVAIGPLSDSHLPLGQVRELTEAEVERLERATDPKKKGRPRKAGASTKESRASSPRPASGPRRTQEASGKPPKPRKHKGRPGAGKARRGPSKR